MTAVTASALTGGLPRIAGRALAILGATLGLSGCVVYEGAPYYVAASNSSAASSDSASTATPANQNCREYRTTATIEGEAQEIHGTACLQPDGTWQYIQ